MKNNDNANITNISTRMGSRSGRSTSGRGRPADDWVVYAVAADDIDVEGCGPGPTQGFAYTSGLVAHGLPELHLWGRPPDGHDPGADWRWSQHDMGRLLNDAARQLIAGSLTVGDRWSDTYDGGCTTVRFELVHGGAAPALETLLLEPTTPLLALRWSLERPEPTPERWPVDDQLLDVLEAGHTLIDQFSSVLGVTAAAARAAGRTDELRIATDLARADADRTCNGPIRRCLDPEGDNIDTSCYRLDLQPMLEAWLTAAYTSLVVADIDLIEPGILDLGIGWLAALVDPERATAAYRAEVAPPLPALAGQVQQALRPGSPLSLDAWDLEQARWRGCARAASRGVGAPITVELAAALAWLVASGDLTPGSVRVA
ncbi:hypothetical protein BH23ACT3_BH23ACT3_18980 [soil metagenome]